MKNIESNNSGQNSVVNSPPTKDEVKGACWYTIKQFIFELLDLSLDTDKKSKPVGLLFLW